MSEFRVIAPDLRVSIPIMSKNTIIEGDSGTGKTLMINKLHAIKNSKMLRSDTKSTVNFDDIIIVRNEYETGLVDMKNTKHKLILLDKADTYLDKHWVDFINKSKKYVYHNDTRKWCSKEYNDNSKFMLSYTIRNKRWHNKYRG